MTSKLTTLLSQMPSFEAMSEATEAMRDEVDTLMLVDTEQALKTMIRIGTNMMELMAYHMQLSAECLRMDS